MQVILTQTGKTGKLPMFQKIYTPAKSVHKKKQKSKQDQDNETKKKTER